MADYPIDSPFSEAAHFYEFRAPYASQTLAYVRDAFEIDHTSRALDLGCGPGTIAIPLSQMVGHVLAIDPSEDMLNQGRICSARANRHNIAWLCARAEEITEALGIFNVVTMGQSFHWMDRDTVLRRLAPMIASHGGLALISPGQRRPQESWETLASEVIVRYLGPRGRHRQMNPEPENEPSLLRSGTFSRFTVREFSMEFERDVLSIIGNVYSMSTSPKSAFGDRAALFERDLTESLLRSNPSGVFKEQLETQVVIARKQGMAFTAEI
jgi:ubiquinone/menaquinone biosynthesis C-methylase UbiE